jgi:glycosyltransferase involved in cell wall biosynthesis
MSNHYDVCLLSFSNPFTDARTLNLANTLAKSKKVLLIALGPLTYNTNKINFKLISIEIKSKGSSWKRWLEFYNKAKLIEISSDFLIACDLYALAPASYLAKKNTAKLIYDSREIYSKLGGLSKNPLKQFVITQIENYFVKTVNLFLVSGDLDAEYLQKHFNSNFKYLVVKNLPQFKEINKSNLLREKFNIPLNRLILVYQGVVLKGRGLIPILNVIKQTNNYHLVIIGLGNFKSDFEQLVNAENLFEKVSFVGEVFYEDLHNYTCSADIGICLFEPISKSYELALPNKLFEYIMAGIPSIATNLPAISEVILKNKNGLLINDVNDVEEIIDNLEKLENTVFRNELSENAKKSRVNYSYESQENLILTIFN